MLNTGNRRLRVDPYGLGIVKNPFGQSTDGIGHGCRKKQILPFLGECGKNPFDVGHEAHVQHPVRFIQYKGIDTAEVDIIRSVESDKTAGTSHDNLSRSAGANLRPHGDAAHYNSTVDAGVAGELVKIFIDLHCQFPGRGQHKNLGSFFGPNCCQEGAAKWAMQRRLFSRCLSGPGP